MKANWNFQRGRGGGFKLEKKDILGDGMDIFWNHTIQDGIIMYLTAISVFRNLASTITKDCKEF